MVAAFDRSVHLAAGGDLICIVRPELGHGPLNALTAAALPALGSAVVLDGAGAATWTPRRPALIAPSPDREAALRALRDLAATDAPADGLSRLALGLPRPDDALARIAAPRVAALRGWLAAPTGVPPPTSLLGLGPGLTPSGDDMLCGVLIALAALGRHDERARLASEVSAAAPVQTSELSRAFLAAAAEGEGAEALHLALNLLLEGRRDVAPAVRAVAAIGHTSGWDALAGLVLALAAA